MHPPCPKLPRSFLSRALLLALVSSMTALQAAIYYVSPSGTSTAPGTIDQPWNLHHAVATATAGDTVYVRGGTYAITTNLTVANSGAPGNWLVFAGYPGETPIIDAINWIVTPSGNSSVLGINSKEYVELRNLHIRNSRRRGFGIGSATAPARHIVIRDCSTDYTYASGIVVGGNAGQGFWAEYIQIVGNKIGHANWEAMRLDAQGNVIPMEPGTEPPNEAITLGRVANSLIANNEVYDSSKEGICSVGPNRNLVIRGNYVHGLDRQGIYIGSWSDFLHTHKVYDNVLIDNGYGIVLNTEEGTGVDDIEIRNNIVAHSTWSGIVIATGNKEVEYPITNISITNNTVYSNGNYGFQMVNRPLSTNIIVRNNVLAANVKGQIYTTGQDFTGRNVSISHNLISGIGAETGDSPVLGDPLFENAALGDFHLKPGSPALDAGHPDARYNDADGSRNDIGALPRAVALATDDFASASFAGGAGWTDAAWTLAGTTGGVTIASSGGPTAGSGNSALLVYAGQMTRALAPRQGATLSFTHRVAGFESGDLALAEALVGNAWVTLWSANANTDGSARVPLPDGASALRFRMNCNWTSDYLYVDDIRITGGKPTSVWTEDFTLANGTSADTGDTAWSVDAGTVGSQGAFAVNSNSFRIANTVGERVWRSEVLSVGGRASLSFDVRQTGTAALEADDYLRVYVRLNEGAEELVYEQTGDFPEGKNVWVNVDAEALAADRLQLVVRTKNNEAQEIYLIDNITVVGLAPLNPYIAATDNENVWRSTATFAPFSYVYEAGLANKYITYASGTTLTASDTGNGQAIYTFHLTETSNVQIHALVNNASGNDDSFSYKIEELDGANNWAVQNNLFSSGWVWKPFNARTWSNVPPGRYTLKVFAREDGAKLQRLFIGLNGAIPQ